MVGCGIASAVRAAGAAHDMGTEASDGRATTLSIMIAFPRRTG
jgi:hypothetical protein